MHRRKGWLNSPRLMKSVSAAKTGNEINSWRHVSRAYHHRISLDRQEFGSPISVGSYSQPHMGPRNAVAGGVAIVTLCAVGCDPLAGTGSGTPPDPKRYIHTDSVAKSVVITLIAGYPAGDYQFNYDGYGNGTLVISIPVGWQATVQCENRGTVSNSCAVVRGKNDIAPIEPTWSTPDPTHGLGPGQSATFVFTP